MPGQSAPIADLLRTPMAREDFRKAVRARQREGQARRAAERAAERAPAYWSCCGQWDETIRDKGHLLTCPFPS
jgi:hypothetical protein